MPDGGVVVLNCADGQWYVFNSGARDFWHCWADGGSLSQSIAVIAALNPDLPRERIAEDGTALLRQLTALGLVESEEEGGVGPGSAPEPAVAVPSAGGRWAARFRSPDIPLGPATAGPGPSTSPRPALRRLAAGLLALGAPVALLGAVLAVRLPFAAVHRAVHATRGRWAVRPEDLGRAEEFLTAVRRAARWYPGRAACLEVSLAAVLMSAACRRRLDWCLGAAPDPFRFHAWIACDGAPVTASLTAPGEDGAPPAYRAVLTV
jgi:hypothetical protein